jgi:hypothetical protein
LQERVDQHERAVAADAAEGKIRNGVVAGELEFSQQLRTKSLSGKFHTAFRTLRG